MDHRYYEILRAASQDEFYLALTDPEDELYDVLWDLFESTVIEAAEIFDADFRDHNQFRYSIGAGVTMEFFPDLSYFQKRREPDPYRDESDAAGIHLKLSVLPSMSCLFTVAFQVWGRPERLAFKKIWTAHRPLILDILRRAKPMVFTAVPFPGMDRCRSVEEMLDHYFSRRDPEHHLELQYSFAQFDDCETAQNFMVYMALLYHSIRDYCRRRETQLRERVALMRNFYSGRLPDLPAPLPCVHLAISSGID